MDTKKIKIKSEYYTDLDDTLAKYDIPEEAREDVDETMQLVEDMILYFTLTTLSN
ncbi:hypothetical protein J0B03_06695 [Alkalibacter rhizosphaerae]|uniref:Uncharacterized protein n=1 Tax=Alkalibacter rhizosphaerae TaxID=2815577 RepID=A0A974XCX5_9FIRM|nr:hypothetical protein [Alkalibacter rhizosphaerae]QSX07527.1 hypothetical protein J0B03_06695 [Alkalibacter rhizosphaerae]